MTRGGRGREEKRRSSARIKTQRAVNYTEVEESCYFSASARLPPSSQLPFQVGVIIGRGWDMIRNLQQRFGAKIHDCWNNLGFTYATQTSQYNGVPSSKKMNIPNAKVGVIIGRGWDMIRNLQQRSSAKIQITPDSDADPTSLTRDVELMGRQEQISRAEELINEVIAETDAASSASSGTRGVAPLQPGSEQFVVKVPKGQKDLIEILTTILESTRDELAVRSREVVAEGRAVDSMENEVLEMGNTLRKMKDLVKSLMVKSLKSDRDRLQKELVILEEKVETAHALAKENETIAGEYQQIAEFRRIYAEEKGEEVRLLERYVLELDSTISVLENKVDNLREDSESQKVKRRELELELHSLKAQKHTFESANAEMKRCLDEKSINLEEALNKLKIVEEDIVNKDREIAQCKGRISELTLDSETQTSKLRRADSLLLQVTAELVQHHARTGTSHSISVNATRRLNNKDIDQPTLVHNPH